MTKLLLQFRFKNLLSTLSDEEVDTLFKALRRARGKEFVLKLLCGQHDPSVTADMIQITSNIIQKRENQQQENTKWTLDTLPNSFIGEIASFLDQQSYGSLSGVNSAVYIGCNDPNRLLSVSVKATRSQEQTPAIKIPNLPQIKKLSIFMHEDGYSEFEYPNHDSLVCSAVETLHISTTIPAAPVPVLNRFIDQNPLVLPRLRTLSLRDLFLDSEDSVNRLFTKFHMIWHLVLDSQYIPYDLILPTNLFTESFPKLRSLSLTACNVLSEGLLRYRGADLVRLELNDFFAQNLLETIDFSNLRELGLGNASQTKCIVDGILKTATNLKQVRCWLDHPSISASHAVQQTLADNIRKLLTHSESLTHYHFEVTNDASALGTVCDAIEMGLHLIQDRKRDILSIGVETHDGRLTVSRAVLHISRLLNKLILCKVQEYMLFWQMHHEEIEDMCEHGVGDGICSECSTRAATQQKMKDEVKAIIERTNTAELIRAEGGVFIIRNKGSNMNSYRKWWNEGKMNESDDERVIY